MIDAPFFLVGAERSGTTLFRLMLDSHPRLACFFEFEQFIDFCGREDEPDRKEALMDYVAGPSADFPFPAPRVDSSMTYAKIVDVFLAQKRDLGGKDFVGATVHRGIEKLTRIWPDARFVHIVRDGRDVARSRISMGWDGNVWTGIDDWIATEELWDTVRSGLRPSQFVETRHEDLIADSERELTRVCEFLGVTYSEHMLDYAKGSTYSLPNPALVQQWRTKATELEVRLVQARAAHILTSRGYELADVKPIQIGPAEDRRMRRQSRWAKRRFQFRRLGVPLALSSFVARRILPFPLLKRHVAARVESVRRRHRK